MRHISGKRLIGAVLLVVSVLAATGCTSATANLTSRREPFNGKRIAVLNVTAPRRSRLVWTTLIAGKLDMTESEEMTLQLESKLMGLGRYQVIDRSQVKSILDEQDFQQAITGESARAIGKLVGVDGIVTVRTVGRLGWIGPFLTIDHRANARLINVATGEIIWTAEGRFRDVGIIVLPMWSTFTDTPESRIAREISVKLKERLSTRPN